MTDRILYAFEELSDDLPRPPLVAVRALLGAGLAPSPRGWTSLPVETRVAIARHGLAGVVDTSAVRDLAQQIPPRFIKLVSRSRDPDPDKVPAPVTKGLGPARPISSAEWRSLRAVDRAVIASLAANTRLLARAYDELAEAMGKPTAVRKALWSGAVARCEVHMNDDALDRLASSSFLDGRALMLARVAGIRAARKTAEILDLHADSATGPVELEGLVQHQKGSVLIQSHVSTWDGAFFPAAALLGATTAAAALFDMIKDEDPAACIEAASIREEAWRVGGAVPAEEATKVYAPDGWAPKQASDEEIQNVIDRASARGGRGATADSNPGSQDEKAATVRIQPPDFGSTVIDPPGVDHGPGGRDAAPKDTVKDIAPGIGPLLDAVAPGPPSGPEGAQPLVGAGFAPVSPPASAPASEPSAPPRPAAPPPQPGPSFASYPQAPGAPAPVPDDEPLNRPRTPKALVALFVASIVILLVALGIFGYVLTRPA